MLLQEIVRTFDAELMRLASLRAIVAGLDSSRIQGLESEIHEILLHPPMPPIEDSLEEAAESDTALEASGKRAYNRRNPAGAVVRRSARRRPVETGAIASAIPAGPVVVSAAALNKERTHRQPNGPTVVAASTLPKAAPPLTAESSNDLARTLAQRWLSGGENASL